jgi:RHH-type proline utilization regulon transcriptional repressor/proline dehydrogenase/delta 1-pyrroline-5-carboxylate dehydrogenase
VQRQPFGGWKRSAVGPGAKAGGPNYVAQLGTWRPTVDGDDYDTVWSEHFASEHDPSALHCESNVFRYRPLERIVVRHGPDAEPHERNRFRRAASIAGVDVIDSSTTDETDIELAARLSDLGVERIRLIGATASNELRTAAVQAGVHIADQPVVGEGRVEFLHLVREQSVSTTRHRFGNPLPEHRAAVAR